MVCAIEIILIPTCNKLEMMGQVKNMPDRPIWLLEESLDSQGPILVAQVLVSHSELVLVC